MIHKGQVVYYYPHGDVEYGSARAAMVMDHSPCGLVVDLKVYRHGEDETKRSVKRFDHPKFEQFPHHRFSEGVWAPVNEEQPEESAAPVKERETPAGKQRKDLEAQVKELGRQGMSAPAIVGRLKDTNITLAQVNALLNG